MSTGTKLRGRDDSAAAEGTGRRRSIVQAEEVAWRTSAAGREWRRFVYTLPPSDKIVQRGDQVYAIRPPGAIARATPASGSADEGGADRYHHGAQPPVAADAMAC